MRLVYSRQALADLTRLREFIAESNPEAARKTAATLTAHIRQLTDFPAMGAAVEEAPPPAEIRDMIFGDFIVRYSVHQGSLAILRVWHHRQNRSR